MKNIASLTLAMLITTSAFSMDCIGSKRFIDERGQSQFQEVKLINAFDYTDSKVHADINEAYYVFTRYEKEKYVAKITFGPDYTRGITSTATFDENKKFELASVDGGTVYKLSCRL